MISESFSERKPIWAVDGLPRLLSARYVGGPLREPGPQRRACGAVSGIDPQPPAAAFYQRAEMHRLRGAFAAAEAGRMKPPKSSVSLPGPPSRTLTVEKVPPVGHQLDHRRVVAGGKIGEGSAAAAGQDIVAPGQVDELGMVGDDVPAGGAESQRIGLEAGQLGENRLPVEPEPFLQVGAARDRLHIEGEVFQQDQPGSLARQMRGRGGGPVGGAAVRARAAGPRGRGN